MYKKLFTIFFGILVTVAFLQTTHASTIDELKQKIEERNQVLKQLDAEITQYQNQIGETSAKAKTLQNTLATLDATIKKLKAELAKTETNLTKTSYTIQQLNIDIQNKEDTVKKRQQALSTLIKRQSEQESNTFIEQLLTYNKLSEVWNYYDQSTRIQSSIDKNVEDVLALKANLEGTKTEQQKQKTSLQTYKNTLADQQKLVQISQHDQNTLLTKTKQTEAGYKKELADRLALKDAFEKELNQFESELKLAVDPNSIPKSAEGVLAWPLDKIIITQQFGDTDFARAHAGAYNGKGHNGVDFGAPIGTPVKSADQGFVVGTGNTDLTCPGASYGNWILIQHPNGLSTLYAHLSLIKVSKGQQVGRGGLIGYTGNTGYTTGPHLHFTVYATQGVEILTRPSAACGGKSYTMPLADLKAYLNPLLFL